MTDRSVEHSSFTIERSFKATPVEVFRAFSEPAAKERWFVNVEAGAQITHDFRVGGRESGRFSVDDGTTYYDDTVYLDIVENRRIIFAYTMTQNDRRISASVATVDIQPAGTGTRLVFTEQVAFLDGLDKLEYRRGGWEELMGALAKELGEAVAA
ncbi:MULTISPECIES: SRPBCC family protein [Ensifer]|uniref:SRPBCC family protein n=1 Tax=Ensifer adhaerens TaxID=106592 RepID=A0ABY8HFR9_ENSAD|nr:MULTISPECIES: SRPBCC family protein [Ensifer]ANK71298.1 polyketide cyclase [Ensifer adhaerens]KDP73793.1 polyketide cyclase [Ensifer adhaerens]KQX23991.1 polyketide cyclase [Ensifer sp. Root423]KQZ51564.1 polyketide cyclase [Ensifer sp. Root558]MBD9492766.1 SRPBCC family protein [Ensifer sp. ENS01]